VLKAVYRSSSRWLTPTWPGATSTCLSLGRSLRNMSSPSDWKSGSGFTWATFFKDSLPSADVIIMGHILHNWGLEEKRQLIAKAHAPLPKGGALIVYEAIIDDERRQNTFGLLMSLNMLIETQAGFDFTGADCRGWMRDTGFNEIRVEPLCGPNSMVVGIK
jgi:hypothetical protein